MSVWDYIIPHRLLINKSLRREANHLKDEIDYYQAAYEEKIEECERELKSAATEMEQNIQEFQETLIYELKCHEKFLSNIKENIEIYASAYFHNNFLKAKYEVLALQCDLSKENEDFLSKQITLIDEEVDILQQRKNELVAKTDVGDIVSLLSSSNPNIKIDSMIDAQELLDYISMLVEDCEEQSEKRALLKLRSIVHERTEYLPMIHYITWLIHQKESYRRHLAGKRYKIRKENKRIKAELIALQTEIRKIKKDMAEQAKAIRYFWAVPITDLNIEIDESYRAFKRTVAAKKDVSYELRQMKDEHSNDSYRWNRLIMDQEELNQALSQWNEYIDLKKEERREWHERKNEVFSFFKNNNIYLFPINYFKEGEERKTDEECIIEERLVSYIELRNKKMLEAKSAYEDECRSIRESYEKELRDIDLKKARLEIRLTPLLVQQKDAMDVVNQKTKTLETVKAADTRMFWEKIFSDTPELSKARREASSAQHTLLQIQSEIANVEKELSEYEGMRRSARRNYENAISSCTPKETQLPAAERNEEAKLIRRKERIAELKKEKHDERKN